MQVQYFMQNGDFIMLILNAIRCSSTVECHAHNVEVAGSTPVSVTYTVAQLGERRAHVPKIGSSILPSVTVQLEIAEPRYSLLRPFLWTRITSSKL